MDNDERKPLTKDKWKGLMKRTLSNVYKRKTLPQEWQKFPDLLISLLMDLQNQNITYETIKQRSLLLDTLQTATPEYLEICLKTCFDSSPLIDINEKFLSFYFQVIAWITDGSLLMVRQDRVELWMLLHLIESENVEALRTMLSIMKDGSKEKDILTVSMARNKRYNDTSRDTISNVEYNSPALIRACCKNNFEIIQVFVSAGYR
jgi:hypothetical protein